MRTLTQEDIRNELVAGRNPWYGDCLQRLRYWVLVQEGREQDPLGREPIHTKITGEVIFGAPVEIEFTNGEFSVIDNGYITAIPPYDGSDPEIVGIVHVPKPVCDKGDTIGEWVSLWELLTDERILHIRVGDR